MDINDITKSYVIKLPSGSYIIDEDTRMPRLFTKNEAQLFVVDKPWLTIIKIN